jgi:uncharacterized protein YebE (UPF0316 family)
MGWQAVAMAGLAVLSVGLWTLRVALTARGSRVAGAGVAAVEAVVFAVVFSNVVGDLGSWDRVAGYAVGVALGTGAGLAVSDRMERGGSVIEVVVPGDGEAVRDAFLARGWPATALPARGVGGEAAVVFLVVRSACVDEVLAVARTAAPGALWTVRRAVAVHGAAGMATAVSP